MTRSRRWRVLGAVVVSFALASCASIPSGGPVLTSDQEDSSLENQSIRVLARPPRPGGTQLDIINGFLAASASFEGDHSVARQFLTGDAARTWEPADGVAVYDAAAGAATALTSRTVAAFTAQR